MDYLFVGIIVFCFVTFIVTSAIIGRILIDLGLKDSIFYNFDTWKLFYNLLKEKKSKRFKVLFWINILSLSMAFSVIVIAAYYYN
jgi:hypothetical protein